MKALILKEYNRFVYEDVPEPQIGPEDVLVRVKACAICGSDVHGMDGSTGRRIPPVVMGHEASGVIEKAGKNVAPFKVGDRVTFDSTVYCGKCSFCRQGQVNLCDNRRVLGVSCGEYRMNGAFAEYVSVPQHILYPLPDSVSFEQAAMVEPLSIAFHAIKRSQITLNCSAVVVGTGMIGLLVVQLLKAAGCGSVIAVDLVQEKLDLAGKFGADIMLKADDPDIASKIRGLTRGPGADMAFEAVGISASLQTAIAALKKGGSLTLVGNLKTTVDFPLQSVVTRQISLYGSCASSGEYPDCLDMIAKGKADVESFISAVAPLSEGASWFSRLYKGEAGLMKVILRP
ncbi:MAG: galactitol-1-phosphate 5-dehydrogenase [Spirochaetia bacterium]